MSLPEGPWPANGFTPHIADGVNRAAFLQGAEVGMIWTGLFLARDEVEVFTRIGTENIENAWRLAELHGRRIAVTDEAYVDDGLEFIGIVFSPVGAFRWLNSGWVAAG